MENSVQSWHRHTSPNHLIRPHQHIRRDRHGKIVTAPGAVSSDVFSHSRRTHIANPDLNASLSRYGSGRGQTLIHHDPRKLNPEPFGQCSTTGATRTRRRRLPVAAILA